MVKRGSSGDIILPGTKKRREVAGHRLIRLLENQLADLHAQPAHGNRTLLADHLVVAHLVAFFNPAVGSLRTVEDVFEHERVQKRLGLPRVPKSTLSDAQRVFDLKLLQPLVEDLSRRIGLSHDARLDDVLRKLVAVDATVFQVASRIAWALPRNSKSSRGAVQMCLHLDVIDGAPDGFTLIGGHESERAELPAALQSGRLYLLDRAYQSYDHLDQITKIDSDYVVRLRSTANFVVEEERPLSVDDRRVGVIHDAVVTPANKKRRFAEPARMVEIRLPEADETVRLLTNRLDLSAEVIGLLYRHRWQIELFFRWLKCVTGLKHFFSESSNGMALQLYVAMIGTMLIALETGSRPSKYDFAQMTLVAQGVVTLKEAKVVMDRRRTERERDAERKRARAAEKKETR